MSALPAAPAVTVEEFESMPEVDGIQELLDGIVVEIPPPKRRHTEICRAVEAALLRHVDRSRVW